jgi:hypothetical protein
MALAFFKQERDMLHQSRFTSSFLRHRLILNRCGPLVLGLTLFTITSYAQGGFVSGSTGADGALNPTTNVTVQLPESGVLNYTTVNIPAGITVRFGKNSRNTPVMILATGNVTIAGVIDVSGQGGADVLGGTGGPGGFNGGNGGPSTNSNSVFSAGVNGDGPGGGGGAGSSSSPNSVGNAGGGGFANAGQDGTYLNPSVTVVNGKGGPRYGLPSLIPLIGGSGGGGDVGAAGGGGGGGGGGGAILIASSGTINFTSNPSTISVRGGFGFARTVGAGGGSGGAVRLIANIITGTLVIEAQGGNGSSGGTGSGGYIRLEAFDISGLHLNGLSGSPRVSVATPKAVIAPNLPTIRIASIAGITPPNQPNGTLQGGPDITLPANQPNPVTVALAASNIPLGALLQVTLTPENGLRVVTQSSALSGTLAASTATASISVPDGICVIQASGTIDVTSSAMMINGERVKTIEVTATFGGKPVVTYVTASNKRVRVEE